jgi:hypothetical protein
MWGPFIGLFPFFLSSSSTLAFFSLSHQNHVHAAQLLHPRLAEVALPCACAEACSTPTYAGGHLARVPARAHSYLPAARCRPACACINWSSPRPTHRPPPPELASPLPTVGTCNAANQRSDCVPIKCCLCCIERRLHPIEVHRSRGAIKLGRLGARTPLFFSSSIGSSPFVPHPPI